MIRIALVLAIVGAGLAGCGVDGEPSRPPAKSTETAPTPGISISGSASVGVVGGS